MQKQGAHTDRKWYAIHTYSGYENAVVRNLKQRVQSTEGMDQYIFDVLVPMEKKVKIKGSKRVNIEEPIYPGYVLVDMVVTDESWFIVRNTPRVTGFVGAGVVPVPLTPEEIEFLFSKMKNTNLEQYVIDNIKEIDERFTKILENIDLFLSLYFIQTVKGLLKSSDSPN
jgi:transcriptional antiterminator NusG